MQQDIHPLDRALKNSREGDKVIYRETDGGQFRASGSASGPKVKMTGDGVESGVDLGLPAFSLEDGSTGSQGGSFLTMFKGDAVQLPAPLVMPLIIAGIAMIAGAGFLAWKKMFKAAGYSALAGVSLIVMGQSLLWGLLIMAALAVIVLWPLIAAEKEQRDLRTIAKPIMTGIEDASDDSRKEVKSNIKMKINEPDAEDIINRYKKRWNLN